LAAVIGWEASVIHDEITTGASFTEAATNPRNLRNGVAVGGIALSGGTLGIPATAGLVTLGAGTDVAMQMNLEGRAYDQVDYERAFANGGIAAGGGALLGVGVGSANAYISTGSNVVVGGLVVAGAAESGHLIGEGLASSDSGQVALGASFAGFSLAGGTALPRTLPSRMSSSDRDASLNALQPKIGAADAAVVVEGPAINPRLTQRLEAWRAYQARGGAMEMREWVQHTQGAPWGMGARSGYRSWSQRQDSTHGNTAGDQTAYLYARYDAEGNFLKWGTTQDLLTRL
jgi:hypothetical protein